MSRLLIALASALWGAGCSEQGQRGSADVPVTIASVDLDLGEIEGGGPAVFGRISGLLGDDAGRIIVADYPASEIRVFDLDGEHILTFGRSGSGPGELGGPCCLAWGPDGLLWVRDGENQRYSGFSLTESGAVFAESRRMAHTDVNRFAAVTFTGTGELVDVGSQRSANGESSIVRFALDANSEVVRREVVPAPDPSDIGQHAITRQMEGGVATYFFYQPFAPRHLVAHGPGGRWANGLGSAYAIALVEPDTTFELRGDGSSPVLSEAERESAESRLIADAERAGIAPGEFPYGIPSSKPPIQAIFFDAGGRLWVQHGVPDGEASLADVWDQDRLVGRVTWPADVSLALDGWVGEDWALGVRRDSLGVQHVVRLRYKF